MAKGKNNTVESKEPPTADSRKKRAKDKARVAVEEASPPGDSLNDCVALCQEERWREALLLCRRLYKKAYEKNDTEMCATLENARVKIEYSLRRQMAASLISASKQLLEKEFLLDVS